MTLPAVAPNFPSRVYVGNTKEATQGVAATFDTSFYLQMCDVEQEVKSVLVPEVTGLPGPRKRRTTSRSAGGSMKGFCMPAWLNWLLKFGFSHAPTNAAAGASVTAYTHSYGPQGVTAGTPPWSFSLFKQIGKITNNTETLCGCVITGFDITSKDGLIEVSAKVRGMGAGYAIGSAEPNSVNPLITVDQDQMVGIQTNLKIDGTPVAAGLFKPDWSISVTTGYDVANNAGSTDGSATGVRWKGGWKVTAKFTLEIVDNSWLADFRDQVTHTYEFDCVGSVIDQANNVNAGATFKFMQARNLNKIETPIKQEGTVLIPFNLEGEFDTTSTHALEVTVTDLVAAP